MPALNLRRFVDPASYHDSIDFYTELKRYGHTLGLSVTQIDGYNNTGSSEGGSVESSIAILADLLDEYVTTTYIKGSMEKVAEILAREKMLQTIDAEMYASLGQLNFFTALSQWFRKRQLNNAIINGEACHGLYLYPVVVAFNDEDNRNKHHAYYIAFNNEYIAISNRGATSKDEHADLSGLGVRIFPLKAGGFEKLRTMKATLLSKLPAAEAETLLNEIKEEEPLVKFKFKPQKVGNCSLANIKSLIKPMLYMLSRGNLQGSRIVSDYKAFTNWLHEHEIKQLIKKYLLAKMRQDTLYIKLYSDLLLQYIKNSQLNASSINHSGSYAMEQTFANKSWWLYSLERNHGDRDDLKDMINETESPDRRTKNLLIIFASLGSDPLFAPDLSLAMRIGAELDHGTIGLFPQGLAREIVTVNPEDQYVDQVSIFNKMLFGCKLLAAYVAMWVLALTAVILAPLTSSIMFLTISAYTLYNWFNKKAPDVVELQQGHDAACATTANAELLQGNTFITSKIYSKGEGKLQHVPVTSANNLAYAPASYARPKL